MIFFQRQKTFPLSPRIAEPDAADDGEGFGASFPDCFPADRWGEKWFQPKVLPMIIAELQAGYEVIICKTAPLAMQSSSTLLLSPATLILLVLDSRKTKMKRLEEAGFLKEDLKLDNIYFLLNRDGYNPSLITAAYRSLKHIFSKNRPKSPIL